MTKQTTSLKLTKISSPTRFPTKHWKQRQAREEGNPPKIPMHAPLSVKWALQEHHLFAADRRASVASVAEQSHTEQSSRKSYWGRR